MNGSRQCFLGVVAMTLAGFFARHAGKSHGGWTVSVYTPQAVSK